MKSKLPRRWTPIFVAVFLAVAIGSAAVAGALWNEADAVHIKPDDIENSTLAIGTHLIHLSALTDALYQIADDSAGESGQGEIYYKSELADGTWFNISAANAIADITTGGKPVPKSEIEALFFTHHTKSDGVTYDLRTNTPVCLFDIKNLYDIKAMAELLPLKNQYDLIMGSVGENATAKRIKALLETKLQDKTTEEFDKEVAALQAYLDVLAAHDGGGAEQGAVQAVLAAADANRRSYVLNKVKDLLQAYMDELGKPEDPEKPTAAELITAVSESQVNVQDSLISYDGKKLAPGTTVFTDCLYNHQMALLAKAKDKNHAACDGEVAKILWLGNLQNDVISDRQSELALLRDELLGAATDRYTGVIARGESGDYHTAVANRSASALLDSINRANTSQVNSVRNELEFLISANCLRLGSEAGLAYIDERIALTEGFYRTVPADDFQAGITGTVDAHMEFLTKKRRALELTLGGNEIDKLIAEKAGLHTVLRSALDKNDLKGAAETEKKIAALDQKIQAGEKKSLAELSDLAKQIQALEKQEAAAKAAGNTALADKLAGKLGTARGELSAKQAGLSDGSLGKQVGDLKTSSLAAIRADAPTREQLSQMDSNIDALAGLLASDSKLVLPALAELHKEMASKSALTGTKGFQTASAKIENIIANNTASLAAALREEKNADDLSGIAEDFLSGNVAGGEKLFPDIGNTGTGTGNTGTGTGNTGTGIGGAGTGTGNTGTGTGGTGIGNVETGTGGAGTGTGADMGVPGRIQLPNPDRATLLKNCGENILLLALQGYCEETGSDAAAQLLAATAQQQINEGNPLIYVRLDSTAAEFVPLSAIGSYAGLRYVQEKNGYSATLAQGAAYYGFQVYSDAVIRGRGKTPQDYMPQAAGFQNGIHICEEYSLSVFGVDCSYLPNSHYAVLCTDEIRALADELLGLYLS